MKSFILLVVGLVCLCANHVESTYGRYRFRRFRRFRIEITNEVQSPNFDADLTFTSSSPVSVLSALINGARRNSTFEFSGDFTSENGFRVTALNGVENSETVMWKVFRNNNELQIGIESIFPRWNDVIEFRLCQLPAGTTTTLGSTTPANATTSLTTSTSLPSTTP